MLNRDRQPDQTSQPKRGDRSYVLYRVLTWYNGDRFVTAHTFYVFGTDGILNGTTDRIEDASKFTAAQAKREYEKMRPRALRDKLSIGWRHI